MYTILEMGMGFLSVRWSVSAYSSATALRDEVPVVPPGSIIRNQVAHLFVSMASRTTCVWKTCADFLYRFFEEAHPVVELLWGPALGPFGRPHLEEGE